MSCCPTLRWPSCAHPLAVHRAARPLDVGSRGRPGHRARQAAGGPHVGEPAARPVHLGTGASPGRPPDQRPAVDHGQGGLAHGGAGAGHRRPAAAHPGGLPRRAARRRRARPVGPWTRAVHRAGRHRVAVRDSTAVCDPAPLAGRATVGLVHRPSGGARRAPHRHHCARAHRAPGGPVAGPASHCSSTTTTSWTPRWPAPTG